MKFILQYLKEYKKESFLAPLFKMLEATFELLVPFVVAAMIDQGIRKNDVSFVLQQGFLLVLLGIVGLIFAITAQYFAAKAAMGCAAKMREDLFCKMIGFSLGQKNKWNSSALLTRLTNDIMQVQNGVNMFLRLFLRSPFIVFGAMIMAMIVDVATGIIFGGVILLLSVIVALLMKSTLPQIKNIQYQMERILLRVGENLEGVRVIRAFGGEQVERDKFKQEVGNQYFQQMLVGKRNALLNPFTYVVVNLGLVAILWWGGIWVNSGRLSQGEVVALGNYMTQILIELVKLANLIVLLTKAFPSATRIEEVMKEKSDERIMEKPEGANSQETLLEVKDVSFSYHDKKEMCLEHISFSLEQGKVLGMIGGTGSGKSTLLKLLYHGYDVTEGEILLEGKPVQQYRDDQLSDLFGVVPQYATLLQGTIRENLTMGKEHISDEVLWDSLSWAMAKEVVEQKEHQLEGEVLQGGKNFSGGQRQRITIARALVHKPKIIILDDSASALDLATEAGLWKQLKALPWKPAVILVSQRASSVLQADEIIVLEDGAIAGKGKHEELLLQCRVYQEIYYSQFPKEEAAGHEA